MQILFLMILGIVQGLTEFLPVSSSGHLVLLGRWFGISDNLFVSIIFHVATLLAVVVSLRKEVWQVIKNPLGPLSQKLCVATIPTCVIVLIIMPIIDKMFGGTGLVFAFLATALILFVSDRMAKKKTPKPLSFKNAFIMGVAQGFAAIPGLSRSATTIGAGLMSGANREETAKFSFLMSVPIIVLSMVLEIYKICVLGQAVSVNAIGCILGFLLAFVVGLLSIKIMLKITQKADFKWFSLYLIVVAILSAVI